MGSNSLTGFPHPQPNADSSNQEHPLEGELAAFDSRNPFVVLGGDPDKTQSEMKALRNELLNKFHPDRNLDKVALAHRITISINSAWEKIKDFYEGEKFIGDPAAFANYLSSEDIAKEISEKIDMIIKSRFSETEVETLSFIYSYWELKYPKDVYELLQGLLRSQKMRDHWKSQMASYKQHGNEQKYISAYAKIGIDLNRFL